MKLSFFGAAKEVTGSCHCLEVNGKKILVDCGLEQGQDEKDEQGFPFNAADIDYVLVTHAHIDHTGRLPLLSKQGFKGKIYATKATCDLLNIMLVDSAHIQQMEAQWKNRKGKRAGERGVEPLYTIEDAQKVQEYFVCCSYNEMIEIEADLKCRFIDAGHLLGSSSIEVWATEGGLAKKLVFSGDIGNLNQPIIRNPQYIKEADYVIMESTYGDRNHEVSEDYTADLAKLIDETFRNGGNVVIPSFAIGRTQELLYFIREMKERRLVKNFPDFPVYVDSPLASEATKIFDGDLTGYVDEETIAVLKSGKRPIMFDTLRLTETVEESKMLNEIQTPKVIISASGMCEAGRIRHHLKHNLWRPECAVVFVGFQARGTLGRALLDGAKKVKLFGETIEVDCSIHSFRGLSAHADKDGLVRWANSFEKKPQKIFAVHGEEEVCDNFVLSLKEMGFLATAPKPLAVYDLVKDAYLFEGVESVKAAEEDFVLEKRERSPVFEQLVEAGNRLMVVIRNNKGVSNRDIKRFTAQIDTLIKKWER